MFPDSAALESFRQLRINFVKFALESLLSSQCSTGLGLIAKSEDVEKSFIVAERSAAKKPLCWWNFWVRCSKATTTAELQEAIAHKGVPTNKASQGNAAAAPEVVNQDIGTPAGGDGPTPVAIKKDPEAGIIPVKEEPVQDDHEGRKTFFSDSARASLPDGVSAPKVAAFINHMQVHLAERFQIGSSLKADSGYAHIYSLTDEGDTLYSDTGSDAIVFNLIGIVTVTPADGALPLCEAMGVKFWVQPRGKSVLHPLVSPGWCVKTVKSSLTPTMQMKVVHDTFTWKHKRFCDKEELKVKYTVYQLRMANVCKDATP